MASRHRSRERALQILYQWEMRRRLEESFEERRREAPENPEAAPAPKTFTVADATEAYYRSLGSEDDIAETARDPFAEELVNGVARYRRELDEVIARHSAHWRLERMSAVDRNILRLAAYEMMHVGTPAPIVLDEALKLAERYSGEKAVAFINGVLDAIRRSLGIEGAEGPRRARGGK